MESLEAIKLLITRLKDQINEAGHEKVVEIADMSPAKEEANKVVYRIAINSISGRFEKPSEKKVRVA